VAEQIRKIILIRLSPLTYIDIHKHKHTDTHTHTHTQNTRLVYHLPFTVTAWG